MVTPPALSIGEDREGRRIVAEEFRILLVCTANICRSPLAGQLLAQELGTTGRRDTHRFLVQSAGVRAVVGSPMDPLAAAELRRLGGDPDLIRARQISEADAEAADLILTATLEQRATVLEASPRALRRTFTLLEFADLVGRVPQPTGSAASPWRLVEAASALRGDATLETYDVVDPIGRSAAVHRQVADSIAKAVRPIAGALSRS